MTYHTIVRNPIVQCEGKEPHPSWSAANANAKRMRHRRRRRTRIQIYRCPHCGFWHVAHGHRKRIPLRPRPRNIRSAA